MAVGAGCFKIYNAKASPSPDLLDSYLIGLFWGPHVISLCSKAG
jgi:hypothetical protein